MKGVFLVGKDFDKPKRGKRVHFMKVTGGGFVSTLCDAKPKSNMYIKVEDDKSVTCKKCLRLERLRGKVLLSELNKGNEDIEDKFLKMSKEEREQWSAKADELLERTNRLIEKINSKNT